MTRQDMPERGFDGNASPYKGARRIPERLLVGPVSYLRSLLTITCLYLPLMWLHQSFGRGIAAVVDDLGYAALYLVWVYKVVGRFADSGRSSNWYWFPFCIASTVVLIIPVWLKLLNRYEALVLFMSVQVALVLLESKPRTAESVQVKSAGQKYRERRISEGAEDLQVSAFPFVVGVFTITSLFVLLQYMAKSFGNAGGGWPVYSCYFVLFVGWMVVTTGRFSDAGWAVDWYPSQFCLVVSVVSVMPLVFHLMSSNRAALIFASIQIPLAFLRRKEGASSPDVEA
jgi:hypothetical protein